MIKNYLKIALRTLWKSKGYTALHVVGLSVAFCVSILLLLTAYFQLSFDRFHQDADRIYQTYFFSNNPDKPSKGSSMPFPLTPALKAEFPEIEAAARVMNGSSMVTYQGKHFDKMVRLTDADFLNIFSFELKKGNRQTALTDLSSIVISEHMAKAVFGTQDPLGQQLLLGGEGNQKAYVVSGVLADFPENSSLQYDAFIRTENAGNYHQDKDRWDASNHTVFIKLAPRVDQASFEKRLKPFAQKYFAENFTNLKRQGAKPDERGDLFAVRLQKLANVHFNTDISGSGAVGTVYAIVGIAFFILLIACINFINLNVARSFIRAREVGVRKSLGALKKQLFFQIWSEAVLICLAGFLLGAVLLYVLIPEFNAFFQAKLSVAYLLEWDKLALILAIFGLVTLVAGGYPAWQMSRFNAVEVLKGKVSMKRPGVLRNSLIVTQFCLSCLLISCTLIAVRQVEYLRQKPLGYLRDEVISIPVGNQENGQKVLQRLRNELADDPSVVAISGSEVNIGRGKDGSSSRSMIGFTYKEKEITTDWLHIDYDYLKTLGIKLLDGREFDPAFATDSLDHVIITESMARALGEKNPVGTFFQTDSAGKRIQIIGLVSDFHLYSLRDEVKPITMYLSHDEPIEYIFVRVAPQSLLTAMEKLEGAWKKVAPRAEFRGTFLDENINAWYKSEQRLAGMFSVASGIAILLSCLGLFAVSLMMIGQRTKEIGVRKVLGASVGSIVLILSRDFVKLVLVAIGLATPLAWFFMQQWLESYPYRSPISGWVFVAVGLGAVLIALATVSFQAIRAALMNPVKSLKTE
ncbi:ABC transporter permease [Rhabdobacter roseus]|uniref:Putative permease n=1 Tax=Rhabdobacter roseus TaxID=1655419 RepID=A0A840TVG1_9BACT|nr:ABC transporter permease [Rhabdobacter roseus]MBB5285617.1 putative permease [Rhabdobacter roseus]